MNRQPITLEDWKERVKKSSHIKSHDAEIEVGGSENTHYVTKIGLTQEEADVMWSQIVSAIRAALEDPNDLVVYGQSIIN